MNEGERGNLNWIDGFFVENILMMRARRFFLKWLFDDFIHKFFFKQVKPKVE